MQLKSFLLSLTFGEINVTTSYNVYLCQRQGIQDFEIYVFNFLACRPYLMVTARSIYRNTESHVAFRKTTAALDTRLISSSAPCHEANTVTPPPKPSYAAALEVEEERSVVYARRRAPDAQGMRRNPTGTNNRGKELVASAGTASCPLLGKATSRKTSMAQDTHPSSSAPCHETKKKRPSPSTPKLPEDFVKKQRAYFADIDAFELAEEEVSETDLD